MRAARYHGQGDVRVEDVPAATVGPGEVEVAVEACGICGSDLHEYVAGPMTIPGEEPHPVTGERMPITIGHEFGGVVADVGEGVSVEVGTPVAVNPFISCGECRYCDEGNYQRCVNGGFVGLSGGGGGFSESVVVDEESVVPLPDGLPTEVAALAEPFAVGLHAIRRSDLKLGDSVAVFGAGPIGLTVVQAAKAAGADRVIVSEPRRARRERAADCGADVLVDPGTEDPVSRIDEEVPGGVDVAVEVAGVGPSVEGAIQATRRGGNVTVVSLFEEPIELLPTDIVLGELTVTGTAAYLGGPLAGREFGMTLRNFERGAFDPEPLITSRIGLEEIVEDGFEALLDDESDQVKILVRP